MNYDECRRSLYNSFLTSTDRGISDEQVDLAKTCVSLGVYIPVAQRYRMLPFVNLLEANEHQYMKLNKALNLILQYVTDLLSPDLPPNWWSLSTKNPSFAFRLKNVSGAEEVFKLAGYTIRYGDFLLFPENKRDTPDKQKLAVLATEILLAREDCLAIAEKRTPPPESSMAPGSSYPRHQIEKPYETPGNLSSQSPQMSPFSQNSISEHPARIYQPPNFPPHSQVPPVKPSNNIGGVNESLGFDPRTTEYPEVSYEHAPDVSQPDTQSQYFSSDQSSNFVPPNKPQRHDQSPNQLNQHNQQQDPPRPVPRRRNTPKKTKPPGDNDDSSGSQHSSPSNSQKFSGPLSESPIPSPDEPLSIDDQEAMKRRTELKKKKANLLNLAQALSRSDNDPSASPRPTGNFTTPDLTQSSGREEKKIEQNNRPIAKPRVNKTMANPSMPLCFQQTDPKTPVRSRSGDIHQNVKTLDPVDETPEHISRTPERIDRTPEHIDRTPEHLLKSPETCRSCDGHLNQQGYCEYCAKSRTPVSPPLLSPPSDRPKIIPRKKKPLQNHQSKSPVNSEERAPVITSRNEESFHPPRVTPRVIPPVTPPIPHPPDLTNEESLPEHREISPDDIDNPVIEAQVHSEVYQKQFEKYREEAKHFQTLDLNEQDDYLDDKKKHNDNVNHLKVYYKGRDWFAREEDREQNREHAFEDLNTLQSVELKIQQLKDAGSYLFNCIKDYTKYGFAPEEVQIAVKSKPQNPLEFLQTTWKEYIKNVETMVSHRARDDEKVGVPSENEARLKLIEAKGQWRKAGTLCFKNRKAKIEQLQQKLDGKIDAARSELIEALDVSDLDVEEAFYAVQRKRLQSVYVYLTSDYTGVIKMEEKVEGKNEEEKGPVVEDKGQNVEDKGPVVDDTAKTGEDKSGKSEMEVMKEQVLARVKKEEDKEGFKACLRMLMAENRFRSCQKAELLVQLLKDKSDYPMRYYIDAAKNYDTFEDAQSFLNQPCPICGDTYLMDDMVVMPACGESLCKDCFGMHFSIVIKEQSVKHFHCPLCDKPDLSNPDDNQDMNLELFVALVKEYLDKEHYELCQHKLTEFNLSKQGGFVWCVNQKCHSGFINDRNQRFKIECPSCQETMCFQCKKKWETQHDGIKCDEFAKWKLDNDPEAQKVGLAAHLQENGIDCPQCNFRYDLARGGCMHFKCTQCPNEFCSGCGGSIKKGEDCGKFENCKNLGLHAHHPRDCLFYLRDFDMNELQKLLRDNEVEFDVDPPQAQIDAVRQQQQEDKQENGEEEAQAAGGDAIDVVREELKLKCCVLLQKERPQGLVDEPCGEPTPDKMAGLCETHYKEYLVSKINKNKVDPIELYNQNKIKRILEREEMEVPQRNDDEEEAEYTERLIQHVKDNLPLPRDNGANA